MEATSVAAVISAGAALVAAIGTFGNRKRISEVHVLVNQRMTDVQARVAQLTDKLQDEGKDVPPDPADPPHYHDTGKDS